MADQSTPAPLHSKTDKPTDQTGSEKHDSLNSQILELLDEDGPAKLLDQSHSNKQQLINAAHEAALEILVDLGYLLLMVQAPTTSIPHVGASIKKLSEAVRGNKILIRAAQPYFNPVRDTPATAGFHTEPNYHLACVDLGKGVLKLILKALGDDGNWQARLGQKGFESEVMETNSQAIFEMLRSSPVLSTLDINRIEAELTLEKGKALASYEDSGSLRRSQQAAESSDHGQPSTVDQRVRQTPGEIGSQNSAEHPLPGSRETSTTGMYSAPDLAKKHCVNREALDQRLRRWRSSNPDCNGWVEVADPKSREPKYLYEEAEILGIISDLRTKTQT